VYVLAQLDVSDNLVIYMPIKLTDEIIAAAIEGFQVQKNKIDDKIAELRSMLGGSPTEPAVAAQEVPVGKRKRFSAAARRKMALGQQARWAKIKGQSEPPSPAVPEAPKAKRKISAEGMKRIIAATKKRWRLQKVENYRLKAGRILLRLKVASRLKPPEGARLQSRLKACWAR
jgi:hypothetical protein